MTDVALNEFSAVFIAEGSSDMPLADLVQDLFAACGVILQLTRPDFGLLPDKVRRDLTSRLRAAELLMGHTTDLVIFHRDADNQDPSDRREEMESALRDNGNTALLLPVVPVRMTEAWLLLDEAAIRAVAGDPGGRAPLNLPKFSEVERLADPKATLRDALLSAAAVTGRRRQRLAMRFDSSRRQLLERLDVTGPVSRLSSFEQLVSDVARTATRLKSHD